MPDGGSRRLKILEVVHAFPPSSMSGTELYTLALSRELQRLGHQVTVLYPVLAVTAPHLAIGRKRTQGIAVLELNLESVDRFPPPYLRPELDDVFLELLRTHDFDLVHFQHVIGLSSSWIRLARKHGLPVALKLDDMFFYCPMVHLVSRDGDYCAAGPESIDRCADCLWGARPPADPAEEGRRYAELAARRAYLREIMREPDFVQVPSRFLRDTCLAHGYESSRLEVLPTGIQPMPVSPRPPRPEGRVRVGYLGAIERRKGIQDLVRAILRLSVAPRDPLQRADLEFRIHGGRVGSRLFRWMMQAIEPLENVTYHGCFTPESRPAILAELDLLVMPSRGENYPFVLREALFAGVPVVATAVAGVPEIVRHGENGWLYPPGDVEALVRILHGLSLDPGQLDRLQVSPARIKTIDIEARELSEIFLGLVSRAPDLESQVRAARDRIAAGDHESARRLLEEARRRHGDRPRVLLGLGVCAFHEGDLEEAFALFARAYPFDRDDPDIVVSWGFTACKLGRAGELREVVQRARALHPEDTDLAKLSEACG